MADVIVAGGGVIGCAVALELARRGVRVTVVERGTPGRAATWAAAGMLSPLGPPGPFRDFAAASFARYPAFVERLAATTGIDLDFAVGGKLHIAFDAEEVDALAAMADAGAAFGARTVSAADARALEPAINAGVRGGVLVAQDGRVDSRRLGEATHAAARAAGVTFVTGSVREVRSDARTARVTDVRLEDGTVLPAAAFVLCAGAWSATIHGLPYPLPVRPVRGQMLALAAVGPDAPRLDRTVESARCYLVPRKDGRIVVGATVEEAGFAPGPTLSGVATLAAAAVEALPALADLPLLETWSGFRPGTADALPILGEDPDLPGLFYATGHYRNGILLAPITAEVIADLVTGALPAVDVGAFGRARFQREEGVQRAGTGDQTGEERRSDTAGTPAEATAGAVEQAAPRCDVCGGPMVEHNCRLECRQCGYTRDCEDP
jgi:glycine oxidase